MFRRIFRQDITILRCHSVIFGDDPLLSALKWIVGG